MSQDTNVENLIINKLTKAQYESITNPDPTQLYFVTDEVISSSDVVNALGYTPYNASNPNNYITASALNGYATETWVTNQNYVNSTTLATTLLDYVTNTSLTTTLADYQPLLVSGTNIKTLNGNSILGSGNLVLDGLPAQTGQSGKFLTTDGTDASWGNLPVATASTVGVVKPDNASIRVSNDGTLSAICRNVGEIISSTLPLTDAGLHLLDGALIQGDGIYKGFVDYIAGLYTENPTANYFTTEALWQQSVTTYGVCGKFVYDSTNNTVRLPKVTGIIEGTTDVTALGDLVEAGLPNITGDIKIASLVKGSSSTDLTGIRKGGCFNDSYGQALKTGDATTTSSTYFVEGQAVFKASSSSSIYGNSSKVQPQTIKVLYYIVIANSTKTEIQADIDQVATDLNGKADVDYTNCSYLPMRNDVVHIIETYQNGSSWYKVYSDGWCEQGGFVASNGGTVSLLKTMNNNTYTCLCCHNGSNAKGEGVIHAYNKTTTYFNAGLSISTSGMYGFSWYVCGYIS